MVTTARKMHWTAPEYTAMEAVGPVKHEFLDGEVFAMAGATPDHNRVAAAALVALGVMLRGGRCRVFNSDQRIFIEETGLYTYADGGVACGRWQIHADGMCLLNPVLLFEVLSPSTCDYDRDAKLEHYRCIPSLRHVILIDQPARCVEHHHRREGEPWANTTAREGSLDLADLGGTLALDEVYLPSEA